MKLPKTIQLLGIAIASMAIQACGEKTLSAADMKAAIENCRSMGGKPTPVYDKADPSRVFRVDCAK